MLATTALWIVGYFAFGALVALIVTPLILYITKAAIYAFAVLVVLVRARLTSQLPPKQVSKALHNLLKDFRKYMNSPIYESDSTKANIYLPNAINNGHHGSVSHIVTSQKPADSKTYEWNQNNRDMVKQPFIPDIPKKVRQISHRIILFYRNYYGHSTKVEKNPPTKLKICIYRLRCKPTKAETDSVMTTSEPGNKFLIPA